MSLKFDLQFFGGGGGSTTQYRKRDPEPEELTNLRNNLYGKINQGLETYDPNKFKNISDEMLNVTRTGNIPSALTNNMNASVNNSLKSSMGSMLNDLAARGVLNSSITSSGINNLSQNAADAYNKNYLDAYNSVVNNYSNSLQGVQADLMPVMDMWKTWQTSYDNGEDYDTVIRQGK